MSPLVLLAIAAVSIQPSVGNHTWESAPDHKTLVELGSIITLVGISNGKMTFNRSSVAWFKDGHLILRDNVLKYTFLRSGTLLVINGFMAPDVGYYLFSYSHNSTKQSRTFYLGLLPPSLVPWYRRNPKVVGTITGMSFLALMMLALVYYCCNTDTDVIQSMGYQKQTSLSHHVQSANDCNFNGGKFSPGIHVATNTGRPKSSREVRQESIITLGAVSKQSIDRLKKAKTVRSNPKSVSQL